MNLEIDILASSEGDHTIALALCKQIRRIGTHNRTENSVPASGAAAALHVAQNSGPGLHAGRRFNPAGHAGGVADAFGVDDDVVFFPAFPVVDDVVDQLLLIIIIALGKQNILGSIGNAAIYPAFRPITSMMLHRSWEVEVSRTLSIASMAVFRAVSNPMV